MENIDFIDKRNQGAWIIHPADKLQDIKETNEYDVLNLAGRCGLLLSSLAASEDQTISIDGTFLNHLNEKESDSKRLIEESFIEEMSSEDSNQENDNWKKRYKESKARLVNKFNFDGCNEYLNEINYFIEQSILRFDQTHVPLRLLYINIAFFLLCLDFITKSFIPLDQKSRIEILSNGFNYGERGKERTENITRTAIKLASSVIANPSIAQTLQREVDKQIKERPVDILTSFFCKTSNLDSLFKIAMQFESFSYSPEIMTPSKLPVELQSIIGLLADFWKIDRKKILL